MTLDVFKTFPPNRDDPVAEINERHDGFVDIPAEVRRENGRLVITLFARDGGASWEYPLASFLRS
jgi:hypothetical protein